MGGRLWLLVVAALCCVKWADGLVSCAYDGDPACNYCTFYAQAHGGLASQCDVNVGSPYPGTTASLKCGYCIYDTWTWTNCPNPCTSAIGYACDSSFVSVPCPTGYYCATTNMALDNSFYSTYYCNSCAIGTYKTGECTSTHDVVCPSCPSGFYCPGWDIITPTACPAGRYCPGGIGYEGDALWCPAGTFAPTMGMSACLTCPTNYTSYGGATACVPMPGYAEIKHRYLFLPRNTLNTVGRLDLLTNEYVTVIGNGGAGRPPVTDLSALSVSLNLPRHIVVDPSNSYAITTSQGTIYPALVRYDLLTKQARTIAPKTGAAYGEPVLGPTGLAFDPTGQYLYVIDPGNSRFIKFDTINTAAWTYTTLKTMITPQATCMVYAGLASDMMFIASVRAPPSNSHYLVKISSTGDLVQIGPSFAIAYPAIDIDPTKTFLLVTMQTTIIYKFDIATSTYTSIYTYASTRYVSAVKFYQNGAFAIVADLDGIKRLNLADYSMSTLKAVATSTNDLSTTVSFQAGAIACGPGTYVSGSACASCLTGTFSSAVANAGCSACNPGTAVSITGATVCTTCSAGQYTAGSGQTSCGTCGTTCTTGTYISAACTSAANIVCSPCPTGSFGAGTTLTVCSACAAATYASATGLSVCSACLAGTFASAAGTSSCAKCAAGTVAAGSGATVCVGCAAGSFFFNATLCAPCLPGNYSNGTANAVCARCPPGLISSVSGATACSTCIGGSYSTGFGMSQCVSCSAGTYLLPGTTTCATCFNNSWSGIGAVACTANLGFFALGSTVNLLRACGPAHNQRCPVSDYVQPTWDDPSAACSDQMRCAAIDGNTVTFSNTDVTPTQGVDVYWVADLQSVMAVTGGSYFTRDCCVDHFRNVDVRVTNDTSAWIASPVLYTMPLTAASSTSYPFTFSASGRYVYLHRISTAASGAINCAELAVTGPDNTNFVSCSGSCSAGQTLRCSPTGTGVCCGAGQFFVEGVSAVCQPCAAGAFSVDGSQTACSQCPGFTASAAGGAACTCGPGYVHNTTLNACVMQCVAPYSTLDGVACAALPGYVYAAKYAIISTGLMRLVGQLDLQTWSLTTLMGTGAAECADSTILPGTLKPIKSINSVAVHPSGSFALVASTSPCNTLVKYDFATGIAQTISTAFANAYGVVFDESGLNAYVSDAGTAAIYKYDTLTWNRSIFVARPSYTVLVVNKNSSMFLLSIGNYCGGMMTGIGSFSTSGSFVSCMAVLPSPFVSIDVDSTRSFILYTASTGIINMMNLTDAKVTVIMSYKLETFDPSTKWIKILPGDRSAILTDNWGTRVLNFIPGVADSGSWGTVISMLGNGYGIGLRNGFVPCGVGYYSLGGNATACIACGPGTVANANASSSCYACPAGTFISAGACVSCSAGTYSSISGSTACVPCAAGTYANVSGATGCAACPTGNWSASGASKCVSCPTNAVVSSSQDACVAAPGYVYGPRYILNAISFWQISRTDIVTASNQIVVGTGSVSTCATNAVGTLANIITAGIIAVHPSETYAVILTVSACHFLASYNIATGSLTNLVADPSSGAMSGFCFQPDGMYAYGSDASTGRVFKFDTTTWAYTVFNTGILGGPRYLLYVNKSPVVFLLTYGSNGLISISNIGEATTRISNTRFAAINVYTTVDPTGSYVLACDASDKLYRIDLDTWSMVVMFTSNGDVIRGAQWAGSHIFLSMASANYWIAPNTSTAFAIPNSAPSGGISIIVYNYIYMPCFPGFVSTGYGNPCLRCPVGTYALSGASMCINCSAGTFASSELSTACTFCPVGTYSSAPKASACASCASVLTVGSSSCFTCTPGQYVNVSANASCLTCPFATYTNGSGQTVCYSCPSGYNTTVTGATNVSNCSVCAVNAIYVTGVPDRCVQCPSNTLTNGSACVCLNGTYGSSNSCSACATGSYCLNGNSIPCPKGAYSATLGATACYSCPNATTNNATGSTSNASCSICVAGAFPTGLVNAATQIEHATVGWVGFPGGWVLARPGVAAFTRLSTSDWFGMGAIRTIPECAGPTTRVKMEISKTAKNAMLQHSYVATVGRSYSIVVIAQLRDDSCYGCEVAPVIRGNQAVFSIVWRQNAGPFQAVYSTTQIPANGNCPLTMTSSIFTPTSTSLDIAIIANGSAVTGLNDNAAVGDLTTYAWQIHVTSITIQVADSCVLCPVNMIVGGVNCSCINGLYSDGLWSNCVQCLAGSYCVGGTLSVCPAGTYSNVSGASACLSCGMLSMTNTADSIACTCAPGYVTDGISLALNCSACQANYYCIGSNASAVACPNNTYSRAGSFSLSACQCPVNASSNGTACVCADGYYQVPNASAPLGGWQCSKCLAGYACTGNVATPCAAGWYSSATGLSVCSNCSAGKYANATNSTACAFCLAGSYTNMTGASECSYCPAGQIPFPVYSCPVSYVPMGSSCNCLLNSSLCACSYGAKPVPASSRIIPVSGTSSGTSGGAVSTTWNNIGHTNPGDFQSYPYAGVSCAAPVYLQYDLGSIMTISMIVGYPWYGDGRQICSTWYDVSTTGSFTGEHTRYTVCTSPYSICTPITSAGNPISFPPRPVRYIRWYQGGASTNPGQAYFLQMMIYASATCPAPTGPLTGSTSCASCQNGTFSVPGASTCSTCPANQTVYATQCRCSPGYAGDAVCSLCQPDNFCPGGYANFTVPCLNGTYSLPGSFTASQCVCPANAYYNGSNCTCDAGFYKVLNASAPLGGWQCVICPKANSCANDTMSPCVAGTYASSTGRSVCTDCGLGTFSPLPVASACLSCAPGAYGPSVGLSQCPTCDPGTFSNSTGLSACAACGLGRFSDSNATTACAQCEIGTFANATGQTHCLGCDANTYASAIGSAECVWCPDNSFAPPFSNTSLACTCGFNYHMVGP